MSFEGKNINRINAPQFGKSDGVRKSEKNVKTERLNVLPPTEKDKKIAKMWKEKKDRERKVEINKLKKRREKYDKLAKGGKDQKNVSETLSAVKKRLASNSPAVVQMHAGKFVKPSFVAKTEGFRTNVGNPNPKGSLRGSSDKQRTNPKKAAKIERKQRQIKGKGKR